MPDPIANTPEPPYYAVIFTSIRSDINEDYGNVANQMVHLASEQPGFLGVESAREEAGITVSYWQNLESIKAWKHHSEHTLARNKGRSHWYDFYKVRICKVERDYGFER